jgi:hypothetical protein
MWVAGVLAACGSSSHSSSSTSASEIHQAFANATGPTPARRAQRLQRAVAFSACMLPRDRLPDPSTAAGHPTGFYQALQSLAINSPAFKATANTCTSLALKETGGCATE